MRRDFDALEKRRLRAATLLKGGMSPCDVARELGVDRVSVYRWEKALYRSGRAGLRKAGRAGRMPRLGEADIGRLKKLLLQGPEAFGYETSLWTTPRVGKLIAQEFGVTFADSHVWWLLRRMGWSAQRPTGRAIERDEQAIERWKKERWPAVKKTPKDKAARSFSSTKAG